MAKEVKRAGSGLADLTKGIFNDVVKPIQNELNPITMWNNASKATGGTGDVFKDVGDGLGVPRNWKEKLMGGPPDAPAAPAVVAAPKEAMPQMDAEAIARARRLAAMKSAGGGRAGTFLGGSGLGNG